MKKKNEGMLVRVRILQVIATLVWIDQAAAATVACPTGCGRMNTSFPFGIGKGCYMSEEFEVTCDNDKAFLPSINMELLDTNTRSDGLFLVNNPTFSRHCNNSNNNSEVDLSRTPFFYSNYHNKFTATGCNTYAELIQGNKTVGRCQTLCGNDTSSGCYGFSCLQAAIPPNMNSYKVNISNNNSEGCNSAFIIRDQWLASRSLDEVLKANYVQATLQWGKYKQESCALSKDFHCTKYSMNCWEEKGKEVICICRGCKDLAKCKHPCGSNNCELYSMGSQGNGTGNGNAIQRDSYCRKKPPYLIIFAATFGFALVITVTVSSYNIMLTKKEKLFKNRCFGRNGGSSITENLGAQIFTSTELEIAADNYDQTDTAGSSDPSSNEDQILHRIMRILFRIMIRVLWRILCRRGEGNVSKGKSKGKLKDGRLVTIKKCSMVDEDQVDTHIKEVVIISEINHSNVVKLIGCCLETKDPLLVYEFTSNRTLAHYIHTPIEDKEFQITWEIRLRIATEVAATLRDLHSVSPTPIYHRDIKSSNILLDEQYTTKLAGLGSWRSISIEEAHVTTRVLGTFGYIDPEYFQSGQYTEKSDVYSFGVVLVELLTGQKPISASRTAEGRSLATSFLRSMEENRLSMILDARVREEGEKEELTKMAKIAENCLNLNGKMRPTMNTVATALEAIRLSQGASSSTITQQEQKDDDCSK